MVIARDQGLCQATGLEPKRKHIDHIIPERIVRKWRWGDANVLVNLILLGELAHPRKTAQEYRLDRGDFVGYRQELIGLGIDPARIDAALSHYGLKVSP